MVDITPLLSAVLSLIGLIITCYLVPYLKSKISVQNQKEINEWVKIAVTAAEQIYSGSGRGEEKKQYVIDWLASYDIKYDTEKIDAMIEAAVYELKQNGLLTTEMLTINEG